MIQTKKVILCNVRSQKFGKFKMIVSEPIDNGFGGTIYTVRDYVIDDDGNEIPENSKQVNYSKEKIDYIDAYIEANYTEALSGLSRTEKEYKKLQIGLMLDTQTNLFSNGKTICGLGPDDWEFTPEL